MKKTSTSTTPALEAKPTRSYYGPYDDLSFAPLTPERELELFKVFYSSAVDENGAPIGAEAIAARDELIHAHLKLVAKLSLRVAKRMLPPDEAISAGNAGLLQAVNGRLFRPGEGTRFSTYIRLYVTGKVLQAVRARDDLPRATASNGIFSYDATLTGIKGSQLSTEDSRGPTWGESGLLWNFCQPEEVKDDGRESTEGEDLRLLFLSAIAQLPETEAATLRGHYFDGKNFQEIGDELHLTREGIRKAHNRGMEKLMELLGPALAELRSEQEGAE